MAGRGRGAAMHESDAREARRDLLEHGHPLAADARRPSLHRAPVMLPPGRGRLAMTPTAPSGSASGSEHDRYPSVALTLQRSGTPGVGNSGQRKRRPCSRHQLFGEHLVLERLGSRKPIARSRMFPVLPSPLFIPCRNPRHQAFTPDRFHPCYQHADASARCPLLRERTARPATAAPPRRLMNSRRPTVESASPSSRAAVFRLKRGRRWLKPRIKTDAAVRDQGPEMGQNENPPH